MSLIWIILDKRNLPASYHQTAFTTPEAGQLQLIASSDGRDGTIPVSQDIMLYRAKLDADKPVKFDLAPGRKAWAQVISGDLTIDGQSFSAGDAAAIEQENEISLAAATPAEVLLFDLMQEEQIPPVKVSLP